MAPLCKGSTRGAGEGLFGKHRKTGRKFLFGTEKNTHSHRLPPGGSWHGVPEGECATCAFLPLSVLEEMRDRHLLNLEAIKENLKQKIKSEIRKQAKPRLSAVFQSRRLLPSRLRVPPSSRRKAYSDLLLCRRRKVCRFWVLKA